MSEYLLSEIQSIITNYNDYYGYIHKNTLEVRLDIQSRISRLLEYVRFREMSLMDNVESVSEASRKRLREALTDMQEFYQVVLMNRGKIADEALFKQFERLKLELPTLSELGMDFVEGDMQALVSSIMKLGHIQSEAVYNERLCMNKLNDLTKWLISEDTDTVPLEDNYNPLMAYIEKSNMQPLSYWHHNMMLTDDVANIDISSAEWKSNYLQWLVNRNDDGDEDLMSSFGSDAVLIKHEKGNTAFEFANSNAPLSYWLCGEYSLNRDYSDDDIIIQVDNDDDDDYLYRKYNSMKDNDWQDEYLKGWLSTGQGSQNFDETQQKNCNASENCKKSTLSLTTNSSKSDDSLYLFLYQESNADNDLSKPIDVLKNILHSPWQKFL